MCSEPVTPSPVAAQYHTTMSKPQAMRAIANKVFGKRPPPNNIWTEIKTVHRLTHTHWLIVTPLVQGQMKPHEIEKLNWWYMPSLKSMRCPLYQDRCHNTHRASFIHSLLLRGSA